MLSATNLALVALIVILVCARVLAWQIVRLVSWSLPRAVAICKAPRVRDRALPWIERLRTRMPRLYAATAPRLHPGHFAGLPLTLVIVAALYTASLLGGLVEEVFEARDVQVFDHAINGFFTPWREEPLLRIFLWITELGAGPTLTAVSIVATGFLLAFRRRDFVLPLWATFLGAQATTWFGKYVIARERPDFIEAASAVSFSFPSAHATASMALYGFLAYVLARDLKNTRARFEIAFWAGVIIAAIGLSRMFLSVHFTSDVIAGFLVGVFWLLVGFALTELTRARAPLA